MWATLLLLVISIAIVGDHGASSFVHRAPFVSDHRTVASHVAPYRNQLFAGGFEYEDPGKAFDQGVENPFKNPELMVGSEGMKIDPARLLGPRLGGSTLYLIGMMGTGKSTVGDVIARRELSGIFCGNTVPLCSPDNFSGHL